VLINYQLLYEDTSMKRSDLVATNIKSWISDNDLQPGDKLPQEKELIEIFSAAKSTIREALKSLEIQGIIGVRTGPKGGSYVKQSEMSSAIGLLSSHFYFKDMTIKEIYQLRIILEPEMAASIVGRLSNDDLNLLKQTTTIYCSPIETPEREHQQRLDEFAFHEVMAELCPNPILSFYCSFLINMLKSLTICKQIYDFPSPELFETGKFYQMSLFDALKRGDEKSAREILTKHMEAAQEILLAQEAKLKRGFLTL